MCTVMADITSCANNRIWWMAHVRHCINMIRASDIRLWCRSSANTAFVHMEAEFIKIRRHKICRVAWPAGCCHAVATMLPRYCHAVDVVVDGVAVKLLHFVADRFIFIWENMFRGRGFKINHNRYTRQTTSIGRTKTSKTTGKCGYNLLIKRRLYLFDNLVYCSNASSRYSGRWRFNRSTSYVQNDRQRWRHQPRISGFEFVVRST